MSKMRELYEKVAADSALQLKFAEILKGAEAAGDEETRQKLSAFAKEEGYTVTAEEMQQFFQDLFKKEEGELSEAEMEQVAGGKGGSSSLHPYIRKLYKDGIIEPIDDLIHDPLSLIK